MIRIRVASAALALVLGGTGGVPAQSPAPAGPQLAGCPMLPPDDIWNTPVEGLPVHPSSDAWITSVGPDTSLKADFGSGEWEGAPIGIPFVTVPGDQPRVDIRFEYADESDPGPYPIPEDAPIEGGPDSDGDRHILVLDRDACVLHEVFDAHPRGDGTWRAGSGAVFDLRSSTLRPDGWTSADAAGLPILPGLVRYDEVAAGEIRHALRFTVPETQRAYLWPARHFASDIEDEAYPPMGARFRLRADVDISGFAPPNQVILRALQRYGMILADNGSAWFLSGAPDPGWDDDQLRELLAITGADLEAVDVSSLMVDADSGQAAHPGEMPTSSAEPRAMPGASAEPGPTASSADAAATALPPITADLYVDGAADPDRADGSIEAPFVTIHDALAMAEDGAVIAVAAGVYAEHVRIEGLTIELFGGHAADFAVRDPAAYVTTLQGDGTDSVVTLIDAGDTVIDGFRITGGTHSSVPEYGLLGGGIYVHGGAAWISHVLIEGNDARPDGPSDSDPLGGGIYADAPDITITDSVIRGNTAGRGGGIAITGGAARITGNRIEDNIGVSDHGGGLYLAASDLVVSGNRIAGNEIGRALGYGWGGGLIVFGEGTHARLSGNQVTDNFAPSVGSGVFIDDGAVALLDHERIHHNRCPTGGTTGGVGISVDGYDTIGSTVDIRHTTIAGNDCETQGGNALYVERHSRVTITDSILWSNGGDDVLVDSTSTVTAAFTLSEEALDGEGNLSTDPHFADLDAGDLHLRSTAGRWDPAADAGVGAWVTDLVDSPAIDAADPTSTFDLEPAPNGGRADLGAYGGTTEASRSARG